MSESNNSLLSHLAFKGGTCLKKIQFGKTGRFSMDLDFTAIDITKEQFKSSLNSLLNGQEHYEVSFSIEDQWDSSDSYGAVIAYSHEWNKAQFDIEVSFREKPILHPVDLQLVNELYFRYCPFQVFNVQCLRMEEVLAEKIRASFQRIRARDLYDLYLFAITPGSYNKPLVKTLAVIKCWQARDSFNYVQLQTKITKETYDWDDLQRLVRPDRLPQSKKVIQSVLGHYAYLGKLEDNLARIVADSKRHRETTLVTDTVRRFL